MRALYFPSHCFLQKNFDVFVNIKLKFKKHTGLKILDRSKPRTYTKNALSCPYPEFIFAQKRLHWRSDIQTDGLAVRVGVWLIKKEKV